MKKIITRNKKINLGMKDRVDSADLPNNTQDIKLVGDEYIDLYGLNLNIVKYELLDNIGPYIHIGNCNINKLVLNGYKEFIITNSTINNIYIKSEVNKLYLRNNPIPNFHGRVNLINEIIITQ